MDVDQGDDGSATSDANNATNDANNASDASAPTCEAASNWNKAKQAEVQSSLVKASKTDAAISGNPDKDHLLMRPKGDQFRPVLHVHFGGSGGKPSNCSNISTVAAQAGFRSVNLAYMNELSIKESCTDPKTGTKRSADCEELVRKEKIYGSDETPLVSIDKTDSIVYRLVKLLKHAASKDPKGKWDEFLDADGVIWGKVMVSGFSQGGGMAGMLSKDFKVARAVFFSKACDSQGSTVEDIQPAKWCAKPFKTSGERMYGLLHREESAFYYSPQAFTGLGMLEYGDIVDADTNDAPYSCSHVVSTGLLPKGAKEGNFTKAHGSMGSNAHQPLGADGLPAMAPAWYHFFTVDW